MQSTSKGIYLLRNDIELYAGSLDGLLSGLMGGGSRQIDGLGGAATTTRARSRSSVARRIPASTSTISYRRHPVPLSGADVVSSAHAVSGAITLGSALSIPGTTVAHGLSDRPAGGGTVAIEHPGVIELSLTLDGDVPVGSAITSTARKLFDGTAFCDVSAGAVIAMMRTHRRYFCAATVTLGLSVVFGFPLARCAPDLGAATANLSLIAGGASTISCMARELGPTNAMSRCPQYLRLTIVVLSMPLVLADAMPRLVTAQDNWSMTGYRRRVDTVRLFRQPARATDSGAGLTARP